MKIALFLALWLPIAALAYPPHDCSMPDKQDYRERLAYSDAVSDYLYCLVDYTDNAEIQISELQQSVNQAIEDYEDIVIKVIGK